MEQKTQFAQYILTPEKAAAYVCSEIYIPFIGMTKKTKTRGKVRVLSSGSSIARWMEREAEFMAPEMLTKVAENIIQHLEALIIHLKAYIYDLNKKSEEGNNNG